MTIEYIYNQIVTGSEKRGHLMEKLRYIGSRSKSSEKFFLSPIFVFCRISLSDPYSKSMPNFKKTPSVPWKDKLLFILSRSRRGMGGVSNWQLKKNGIALRLLHAIYSLPLAESLPLQRVE